jgi:hypothetical protein
MVGSGWEALVATFSSGKRTAQALIDGMEWSGPFGKRKALRSAADGSKLMRKTITIPASECFHHVVFYYARQSRGMTLRLIDVVARYLRSAHPDHQNEYSNQNLDLSKNSMIGESHSS